MTKRECNIRHKDKKRHGGIRMKLIEQFGLICSRCGKEGTEFDIVTHHSTWDNTDHSEQELLCRACHCREHHSVDKKPLSKEQILLAIQEGGSMIRAEKILGISKETLYRKRKEYNLVIKRRF